MSSTKATFTVLEDKVADADTFDVDNAIVGVVSSGQFRAKIPLQNLISERATPDAQPFIACPAVGPIGGRSADRLACLKMFISFYILAIISEPIVTQITGSSVIYAYVKSGFHRHSGSYAVGRTDVGLRRYRPIRCPWWL